MSRIGYMRVSSETQNLDRQQDAFEALNLDRVFTDKASGRDAARPGLQEMLGYIRAGDTLVVESISRLARSTRDLLAIVEQVEAKNVAFVSLKEQIDTGSPQGRFVLTIFAALVELERETIRQRQAEGFLAAKKRGKVMGRPPATYPADWDQVYAEWQAGTITAAAAMRRLGLRRTTYYALVKRHQAQRERVAS
jgi:DNA invertase Pin-like site-specific DNA recombinase